ncbi:Panacea domain-containing protein [Actinoplanes sp. CA-051413]|uniref:Panacea domain-containing protein n=1 Tax=Actinoplanes sp. CA-051413 TaxID=3239899 RepID=UPI003D99E744
MISPDESSIRHTQSNPIDTFRDDHSSDGEVEMTTAAPSMIGGSPSAERWPDAADLRRYLAPMTTSAHAVTAALHQRRTGLGASRLNSLLYLCQGHHLGDLGEPLFAEPLFAVAGGAVVEDYAGGNPDELADEHLNTIGYVIARYGNLSAGDLRTLVRAADPWKLAAARPEDPRIEWLWLQDWFERQAAALEVDEPRLSRQQMTQLAERALTEPLRSGEPLTRDVIEARIAAARERTSAP